MVFYQSKYSPNPRKRPPKMQAVAYGRWSFTRIEPQEVSSEKEFTHIYFMEGNLLHSMSDLGYVWFNVFS